MNILARILQSETTALLAVCRRVLTLVFAAFLINVASGQVTFQANATSGCTPLGVVIQVTSPAAGSISSYAWTITTPTGSQLTASTSQYVAIFSQPGAYSVSLTVNGNQTQTINNYITVHAKPVANFTVNDPTGCFPLCVQFSDASVAGGGAIQQWSWDFGDGGVSNVQNPSYCYNQAGNFTPILSVSDVNGCFASVSMPGLMQVTNNFPAAAFTLSSQLDCHPPVAVSITNSSTGTSALTSSWNFGDGGTLVTQGTQQVNHNFTATGNFNVCLTVEDQIGCQATLCKNMHVFDQPNATFTFSTNTACEGVPIQFQNTTVPVPPVSQWDFNGDGVMDSNNATANYSFLNDGTYSPALYVSYSPTCKDTLIMPQAITITDGTNVNFIADTLAACSAPFTVQFTNTSVGSGAITYQWFVNNVFVSNAVHLTHTFNAFGSYNIRLVATNAQGCVNQHVKNNYILVQAPTVSFNNAASVCTEMQVPIFNVNANSVDPVAFYFWDFNGDGVTDAQGLNPGFVYTSPGTFNITLTIETINGCIATYTNTQTISVLTQVSANFTASTTTTCAGQPIEFCVQEQPGNTFSWNFYDGSGWVLMPFDQTCIIHDYADTGYFDLTLTVFNGACNVLQTFTDFVYVAPPLARFEYQVSCADLSTVQFFDSSIGADSLVWDFGDGSPLVINELNPTHSYATQGVYTVVLTAYNNELGCPDIKTTDITVSAPVADLVISPTSGCPPLTVNIQPVAFNTNWEISISNGDHITANWLPNMNQWQVIYSHDGIVENTMVGGINSPFMPAITIEEGGFFDVLAEVVDANGCTTSAFYDDVIHVAANPNFASFTTVVNDACQQVSITFNPNATNLQSCQWLFSDGTFSTQQNPTKIFNPPYNYNGQLSATLTAIDVGGCTSTVTQPINLVLPPVVNFNAGPQPKCIGDVINFVNTSVGPPGTSYSWNFGDPTSASNTATTFQASHAYMQNGSYTVCLMADNGAGCVRTNCQNNVVQIVNPVVSFDYASSINNCLYGVQFQNTTPGISSVVHWDFGDDQVGWGANVFHTYPLGVYDVALTVTNNHGCTSTLEVPDIFNFGNQIGPFTQVLDEADCAPFDVHFESYNPADTYFTYFWDFNDGSGDPSGSTLSDHTYLHPGTYCASVIMTDPNGCNVLVSCTEPIVVNEFVLEYSAPPYICFGDTIQLQVNNGDTYQWATAQYITQGTSLGEYLLHPTDDFTYILTGYYSDCVKVDTIHVEVRDLPVVTLVLPSVVCHQDAVFELNTGWPNEPSGTYYLSGNVVTQFDPNMTPGQSYQITYRYTDTFSCTSQAVESVYLKPLPALSFPAFEPLCEDAPVFTLNQASPAGGTYSYMGNDIMQFDPITHGEGLHTILYRYTDMDGCSNQINSSIMLHPLPEVSFTFDDVCRDIALEVTNTTQIPFGSIAQYTWNFGAYGTQNGQNHAPVLFNEIGPHPFSLTAVSAIGCLASVDTIVHVWAVPQPMFTPNFACQNTEQSFYYTGQIEEGFLTDWIWQTEGQAISSPDSLLYTYHQWGPVNLSITAVSDHGCDETYTGSVNVRPAPEVDLVFEDACFGEESVFIANESLPFGGVVSREWQFGDDHPFEYESVADNTYESPGTYSIHYTATSNLGCTTVVLDEINIHHLPEVDLLSDPWTMCVGDPFNLMDLSTVQGNSNIGAWSWSFDQSEVSTQQNPTMVWMQPGNYDLKLRVTTNHGCESDSVIHGALTFYPRPSAGFLHNEHAAMYHPYAEVVNTASQDVTSWFYDFGDNSFEVWPEGSHEYSHCGTYTITQYVRNTFGCKDTAVSQIVINEDILLYIPSAFTPDANGHNEVFVPVLSGIDITHYDFAIFNRWGVEVFRSTTPGEGWPGNIGSIAAPDGVYNYTLEFRSETNAEIHKKLGSVILLR